MNLDFRADQALAGARAFQVAQHAQSSDAQQSYDDPVPTESVTAPASTSRQQAA